MRLRAAFAARLPDIYGGWSGPQPPVHHVRGSDEQQQNRSLAQVARELQLDGPLG